jgi:hypothetical protein
MKLQCALGFSPQDNVYEAGLTIESITELRYFMESHVYAVWDFMSLLKYLQNAVAPAIVPWQPPRYPVAARLINEIVCDEESDILASSDSSRDEPLSHFGLYLLAMDEVGADTGPVRQFMSLVRDRGVNQAIAEGEIPLAAKRFMQFTFSVLAWDEPHLVAAAFCVGREEWLPRHFESLLRKTRVKEEDAPGFYAYLRRHVDLDGNEHGPAVKRLLAILCGDDPVKTAGAKKIARDAVKARNNLLRDIRTGLALLTK